MGRFHEFSHLSTTEGASFVKLENLRSAVRSNPGTLDCANDMGSSFSIKDSSGAKASGNVDKMQD